MAGHGRRGRIHKVKPPKLDEVRNEINVTPLVDVCLVLLIIFMVVTPMLARGKEVPLPRTTQHQTENDSNQPIVAMDIEGKMYFDKERIVDLETIKRRLEEAWRADDTGKIQNRVYVKGDKELPYGKVYPMIMAIRELGVSSIDLGTNELKEDKD